MDNSSEEEKTPLISPNQSTATGDRSDQASLQRNKFEFEQMWMSMPASAILVSIGLALVIWFICEPHSPGWCIGVLAAAAGIVSLRTDGMRWGEKLAWIIILVFLTVLELNAINRADAANEATRNAQNHRFNDIAEGLKESMKASKEQYDSTMTQVNGVLTTTRTVAGLATQTLENVTGGDSFAYLDFEAPNIAYQRKTGKFPLSDVTVIIQHVAPNDPTHPPEFYVSLDQKRRTLKDFPAGELDSHYPIVFKIEPKERPDALPFGMHSDWEERTRRYMYFLIFESSHRKWYENARMASIPPMGNWVSAIDVYQKVGKSKVMLYSRESKSFPKDFPIGEPKDPQPIDGDITSEQ